MKKASPAPRKGTRTQSPDAQSIEGAGNGDAENLVRSSPPLLSVMAGSLALGAVLCFLGAGLVFATAGRATLWGWALVFGCLACGIGAWLGRVRSAKLTRDAWGRQRLALGANAVFSSALLGVVLVGLNAIAARHHTSFDLTTNRINTLSPQTQRVLARLNGPVRLIYLYVPRQGFAGRPESTVSSLLETYRNASAQISTESVNVVADPLRAQELNPRTPLGQYGAPAVLLVERDHTAAKDKQILPGSEAASARQETSILDEANVTSALLRLIDPKPRVFYYLTGHSELDPLRAQNPLRLLTSALVAQNVQLKPLSLFASRSRIPADAATLFAVAPRADLSKGEAALLQAYLAGGGHFALLLFPSSTALPRWGALLQGQGLRLGTGFVVDAQHSYQSPDTLVGIKSEAARHPILDGTSQNVLFPFSAVLKAQPDARGLSVLFQTSAAAQCATVRGARQSFVTQGEFARGPYMLSAAVQRGQSRCWVTASASSATDAFNPLFGDGSFALAGLNWAAGDPSLVSIPPRPSVTYTLSASSAALRFIQVFSLITLPLFILIAGGIVWWRRR